MMRKKVVINEKLNVPFSISDAVNRKCQINRSISYEYCYKKAEEYCNELETKIFKGIVFDYDQTLHNKYSQTITEKQVFELINIFLSSGISIGIATGNGEYIAEKIREMFEESLWSNIIMGYYNGGLILPLSSTSTFKDQKKTIPLDFLKVKDYILKNIPEQKICAEGLYDNNPYQLNFFSDEPNGEVYMSELKSYIQKNTNLKILSSPHSIDVIPIWISKRNVFKYINVGKTNADIVSIGDSGQYGGNDYELLNHKFGLSVDKISDSLNNCWNFSPNGIKHLESTLFYFQHFAIDDCGTFMIKM